MRLTLLVAAALLLSVLPAAAQLSDEELRETIAAAQTDPTVAHHLEASNAARLMRDYDAARTHLDEAWDAMGPVYNGFLNNTLMLELASGGGILGAQRAFREFREAFYLSPITISNIAGNYPELLATGEFDAMMLRMSPDATDPEYRCACYNTVAWAHRLAGREEEAQAIWSTSADAQLEAIDDQTTPDAEAQARGQLARNLARAGRDDEAREQLRRSMAIEVSDAARPAVQRRWAQAYAELGDAAEAVEALEPLLAANSLLTVHTLESRVAWDEIRDAPEFQALLERHR